MRIQPQRHDLVLATHGRGFWILDDLGAISGLSKAMPSAACPRSFRCRPRTRGIAGGRSTTERIPTNAASAREHMRPTNPPEGAAITYYLPSPSARRSKSSTRTGGAFAASTRRAAAGVQRTAWDLTETPPVAWLRARDWNRGGDGATVVPGRYTVALHASDREPPWRRRSTCGRIRARRGRKRNTSRAIDFVKSLNDELSAIDVALNRLDAPALPRQGAR